MQFHFIVGESEERTVQFSCNPFWGFLKIEVDGCVVQRDFQMFSFEVLKTYNFWVGEKEMHEITIEKERSLLFAGFRPQKYRVYIDNVIEYEYEGI